MKRNFAYFVALISLICISYSTASAQAWTLLGSAKVNGHADYDEISVTSSEGDFKAIKLMVENEGIEFDHVVVHFGNGGQDKVEMKHFIPAGGETRVLQLPGGDRVIKKVSFYYKSNAKTNKKAKVLLYGHR